jgi:hypothetical protein
MRRLSFAGLFGVIAAFGACSLIDAPPDVIPGSGGAGGMSTATQSATVSATHSATSSATSTGTAGGGGSGGGPCTSGAQCKMLDDPCNIGACVNGGCVQQPDPAKEGKSCDDGLFCTVADVCTAGKCGGAPRTCPDMSGSSSATGGGSGGTGGLGTSGVGGNSSASGMGGGTTGSSGAGGAGTGTGGGIPVADACHVDYCDENQKACAIKPGNDGQSCDDGDPCSTGENCFNGVCGGSIPTDCSMLTSECGVGTCLPGVGCGVAPAQEGFPCDAMNPCSNSKCQMGKCNFVSAKNTNMACDDGLFCTVGEKCQLNGACGGGNPKCSNPTPCIQSTCNEVTHACDLMAIAQGQPCTNGNSCVGGETCDVNGSCNGGNVVETYFYENFANNNKGWLLGPEWGIGPAVASTGGQHGADPATDHSPTADNGEAGVVIGGNENPVIHAPYYITSPVIDISAAAGQLYLTFYRWINSDYVPYMRNTVEVYDGTKWVEVQPWTDTSPGGDGPPGFQDSPPVGAGWTFQALNITAYKNPAIQVRFGYRILSAGVFTIGSWNLDDVKLQNTNCPAVP